MEIPPLSEREKAFTAMKIAEEIHRRGTEHNTQTGKKPNAWDRHMAAVALQVHLIEVMAEGGTQAVYVGADEGDEPLDQATILLAARSEHRKSRQAAHELGHHLQKTWVAPVLYGTAVVYCNEGQDNELVRHEIAEYVEEILQGDE